MSEERIKLPRVSPEDLVEGKRYVAAVHGDLSIGVYEENNGWPRLRNSNFAAHVRDSDWIWGPLPEFELEGE